jgi:hypothetical protein
MSLQRAYVNCKRCYELSKDDAPVAIRTDDQLYHARNEAMRALEHAMDSLNVGYATQNKAAQGALKEDFLALETTANEALTICMKCDYSGPSIADFIDGMEEIDIVDGQDASEGDGK